MTAHQESNESKDAQKDAWHVSRLFAFILFQVNLLQADGIMRSTPPVPGLLSPIMLGQAPVGLDHDAFEAHPVSGTDVARIVMKLAERAGLDAGKYAGHSLRAGHAGNLFRENNAGKLGP